MGREFQVTFDCHDPAALSLFWRDALGYVHPAPPGVELGEGDDPLVAWDQFLDRMDVPVEQRNRSSALQDPAGRGPRIFFQQVPEGKVAKNRMHLDVRAAPGLKGEERLSALEAECSRLLALGQEVEALGKPIHACDDCGEQQQQGEIALHHAEIPGCGVQAESRKYGASESLHQSSTCKMARNASWGTSTEPICFMRFLPAFCFSRSFFLREISPP